MYASVTVNVYLVKPTKSQFTFVFFVRVNNYVKKSVKSILKHLHLRSCISNRRFWRGAH